MVTWVIKEKNHYFIAKCCGWHFHAALTTFLQSKKCWKNKNMNNWEVICRMISQWEWLKTLEIPLVKKLLIIEPEQPTFIVQFLSCPSNAAFDWLPVPVTVHCGNYSCRERSFSKIKQVKHFLGTRWPVLKNKTGKTFLRNSMTSDRLSNIALLSTVSARAHGIDLEGFVDEFFKAALDLIWVIFWTNYYAVYCKCHE